MNDPRSSSRRDILASRFAVDTWPAIRDPGARVSGFGFDDLELPGYRQHRVVDAPPPPGALAAHESVWVDVDKPTSDDAILLVDVYECESPEQAREVMLGFLGQIESPSVDRIEGFGEVAFSPGEGAVFYVRGNLAVRVLSGGPAIGSVAEPARRLDEDIRRRSEGGKGSP